MSAGKKNKDKVMFIHKNFVNLQSLHSCRITLFKGGVAVCLHALMLCRTWIGGSATY